MTFAEMLLFIIALVLLYLLLSPLQRHLEPRLRKLFRSKSKFNGDAVIDITDYNNKKKPKDPTP